MTTAPVGLPIGLGLVGAGGFATFLAESTASLPSVALRAVADARPDAARRLAAARGARPVDSWEDLLVDDTVDAVVVATPPASHAAIAVAALEAGKHVFCEKPLALDDASAGDVVAAVERTGNVLVVDHVLRYNPLLRALTRLRGSLLGPVQRFCFENDASDEDLDPDHWFWDETSSGGIFVEHGVHFFDAAAMLIDHEPTSVQAVSARREDGPVDLVSATVSHGRDTLATHTHSFTHAHRCERQLMRLDCGPAEVRVEGWIPVEATIDAWTDDAGLVVAEGLPERMHELLHVPGFRLGDGADLRVSTRRNAAPARARGRGTALDVPHHVRVELTLGGHPAKAHAYAESVRAAITDLATCITEGGRPHSGAHEGAAAVAVAGAATRSAAHGRTEHLSRTSHRPLSLRLGTRNPMDHPRPRRIALVATLLAVTIAVTASPSSATGHTPTPAPTPTPAATTGATGPLTNLDHLDWLSVPVTPPVQDGHTTYRLDEEPSVGVLWTYAEPNGDGTWKHVGGGTYHPDTDTWGQGAYNADDVSRAAVVYLRHWQATGSTSSEHAAYEMLRGLTYLQTASGPNAGNVVLWMQPDGTLNPSADPKEQPDPSDSDASYWLARTIWALGEGYAAFQHSNPAFASFLRDRLELAIAAVDRQVLDRYGDHLDIDGQPAPAWLIADGADASGEAVLGLSAYVSAGGSDAARTALTRLSEGIAELRGGDARSWPMGAVRPWALSRSQWHAWGGQAPAALARASTALGDPALDAGAVSDSFIFDPWLLTSGGPDNGRMPTRGDTSQIAYGADSRVESLVATADSSGEPAALDLAGIAGAWFFGANPAGQPMYDPSTGVTYDGISGSGTVNHNSGAESTIHGLLSMIALDEHPAARQVALTADVVDRQGTITLQGEDGALKGDASATRPPSLWTGESLFGGTGYAALGDGGSTTMTLPEHPRSLVLPVVDLRPGSDAVTTFREDEKTLGRVASGDIGEQGDSPAPGALLPVTVPGALPAGATTLTATTSTGAGDPAALDAVMLEPLVSRLVLGGDGHGTALLHSASTTTERTGVKVPGSGTARVRTYDGRGHLVAETTSPARTVTVSVPAGGFALVRR